MTKVTRIRETAGRRREVVLYRSTTGTLYAQSESHPNVRYNLGATGDRCQCKGFQHRATCKHVQAAALFTRMTAPQPPAKRPCRTCGTPWATDTLTGGDCPVCLLWPGR